MRFRFLLPAVSILYLVAVVAVFLRTHGVNGGDYRSSANLTDAPTEPGEKGLVFFNRWEFWGDRESAWTKGYLLGNALAFKSAKGGLWALGRVFEEFRSSYPFGLSYPSYTLLLATPLSVLQWFFVGWVLDLIVVRTRWSRTAP